MSNITETRFYVELPADQYGNTSMPPAVVEARFYDHGGPDLFPCTNPDRPDRPAMFAIAPAEIVQRWPNWYADAYGGWAEVEGPARMLTRKEWKALVSSERKKAADRLARDLRRQRGWWL